LEGASYSRSGSPSRNRYKSLFLGVGPRFSRARAQKSAPDGVRLAGCQGTMSCGAVTYAARSLRPTQHGEPGDDGNASSYGHWRERLAEQGDGTDDGEHWNEVEKQ